jgi:hypothetical protein
VSKLKPPRQHHVVPATYLAGFCIPGTNHLFVLDLSTGKIWDQAPRKILRYKDYFRQKHAPIGFDQFVFEKVKGNRIEAKLTPIINKICRGGHEITEDELIIFIQHIELQYLTTQRQVQFFKSLGEHHITAQALGIPEVAEYFRKGLYRIEMKDEYRFTFLHEFMTKRIIFTYLANMNWNVWEAPDGYNFITSDNPINIYNPAVCITKAAGIGLAGSTLYFPLNSRYCLEIFHPEILADIDPMTTLSWESYGIQGVHLKLAGKMQNNMAESVNYLHALQAYTNIVGSDKTILLNVYEKINT